MNHKVQEVLDKCKALVGKYLGTHLFEKPEYDYTYKPGKEGQIIMIITAKNKAAEYFLQDIKNKMDEQG